MCCSGDCWVCCIAELLNKKHLPSPELGQRVALAAIHLMHAWCYSTGMGLPASRTGQHCFVTVAASSHVLLPCRYNHRGSLAYVGEHASA